MSEASRPLVSLGRELVQNLLVTLRSGQLYEPENDTLQAASKRLADTITHLWEIEGWARLESGRDTLLVNGVAIRGELRHYTIHQNLGRFLRSLEVGGFEWPRPPDAREVARFAHTVGQLEGIGADSVDRIAHRLREAGVEDVDVLPPRDEILEPIIEDPGARARAERTYRHGVAVTRDFMDSIRAGRAPRTYQVKRAVQSVVGQVLEDEKLLIGLTNLRDYDQPTFTHSVNVCVFSVSLGQKIGLSRFELYSLGMCGLMHDIGKVDVPEEILQKAGELDNEEWQTMRDHTRYGVLRLLEERTADEVPIREMLVAFEHHLNADLSGYPELFSPRKPSFFTKIVSICDAFDAGTTPRVYKTDPISPPDLLRGLMRWSGTRYDPILLKAFVSLLGIFPPGTLVLLDTLELAIVMASNPDPELLDRPRVRIVADTDGNRVDGPVVSLAERIESGEFARTIIKVLDADRYGIDVGRYFLAS